MTAYGGILHVTTVHRRGDTRIYVKELGALAATYGRDAGLLVADGQGGSEPTSPAVRIFDAGRLPVGRLRRAVVGSWRVFRWVRRLGPVVVHVHDPELAIVGIALRLFGHKLVYDAHEDLPRQILAKHWVPRPARRPAAWLAGGVEWCVGRLAQRIIAATPAIAERFPEQKTTVVQNFPALSEFPDAEQQPCVYRSPEFAYIGNIEGVRGAQEMVRALESLPASSEVRLHLAGAIAPVALDTALRARPGWARVHYHGWASRAEVVEILGRVRAGLVVLHPTPSYIDSFPVKMFEYMAAGLPVIASDFPLWREIIDSAGCGLLVDPLDIVGIAAAMQWILENPEEARAMGQAGRRAVKYRYNWERETGKLLGVYEELLPPEPELPTTETQTER